MRIDEFSYGGIESGTYNIICKTTKRQLLPAMRTKTIAINGKHGLYDFGNNDYEHKVHEKRLVYVGEDISDLHSKKRQIATWLHSTEYKKLIFGDETDKYDLARVVGGVDIDTLITLGECEVVFECQPMAQFIFDTSTYIILDDEIPLDSDITLDNAANYAFDVVASPTVITIENAGTIETGLRSQKGSKFNIEISGSFTTLSITMNGKTINYNEAVSGTVVIDNINATIKTNGVNKISKCSGDLIDFLTIIPGENTVTITGTGLNCSVLFDYRYEYL
jgi:predicted phage tail component-like protein